jgi:hypothetical protein
MTQNTKELIILLSNPKKTKGYLEKAMFNMKTWTSNLGPCRNLQDGFSSVTWSVRGEL